MNSGDIYIHKTCIAQYNKVFQGSKNIYHNRFCIQIIITTSGYKLSNFGRGFILSLKSSKNVS